MWGPSQQRLLVWAMIHVSPALDLLGVCPLALVCLVAEAANNSGGHIYNMTSLDTPADIMTCPVDIKQVCNVPWSILLG